MSSPPSTVSSQLRLTGWCWLAALASSLAFSPLFETKTFLLSAVVLSAPPVLLGAVLRGFGVPWYAVLPGQLMVLATWMSWLQAPETLRWLMVPTQESATTLVGLVREGVLTSQALPPPVPDEPGIVFIAAAGITLCCLLVDLLGAGLVRVPLTGLPLLALYTVPAAIAPNGVPAWSFVVGAVAYVALLASQERERLTQWGRQISLIGPTRSETERRRLNASAVNASAQRIGFAAIAVAAAVPVLLPAFPGFLDRSGSGGGGGGVRVENPIVDLQRDLVERSTDTAMYVRTRGAVPEYFRLAALDEFDGERWTISDRSLDTAVRLERRLEPPPGLSSPVDRRQQRFFVDVSAGFESDWLPAPYAPRAIAGLQGDWRFDLAMLDIVAGDSDLTTAGLEYAVDATIAQPTAEQLAGATIGVPANIGSRYGDLPDSVPDEVVDITDEVTAAETTQFGKALALQEYFTGGQFEYSLTQVDSGHDGDAMLRFLQERVGYCEQFAATMAVMARLEGIPSRVSVGFLRASSNERLARNVYEFRYADMHAWPELYFVGIGWVRFEPTPPARPGAVAPEYTTANADGGPNDDPTATPTEQPSAGATPTVPGGPRLDPGQGAATGQVGSDGMGAWWVALVALAVAVLLAPALLRLLVRRTRWSRAVNEVEQAEVAWAELRDSVRDLRLPWPVRETPRGTVRALGRLLQDDEALTALGRLALAVERARFSRRPVDGGELRDDVTCVRTALRVRQPQGERLRAVLLPASLRAGWRERSLRRTEEFRNRSRGDDATALPAAP